MNCPRCNGPVKEHPHSDAHSKSYISTAAEQLAIEHENVLTLKDELANTLSNNDTLKHQLADKERELVTLKESFAHHKFQALEQQLADKERDYGELDDRCDNMRDGLIKAHTKLDDANAVVEAARAELVFLLNHHAGGQLADALAEYDKTPRR